MTELERTEAVIKLFEDAGLKKKIFYYKSTKYKNCKFFLGGKEPVGIGFVYDSQLDNLHIVFYYCNDINAFFEKCPPHLKKLIIFNMDLFHANQT